MGSLVPRLGAFCHKNAPHPTGWRSEVGGFFKQYLLGFTGRAV